MILRSIYDHYRWKALVFAGLVLALFYGAWATGKLERAFNR